MSRRELATDEEGANWTQIREEDWPERKGKFSHRWTLMNTDEWGGGDGARGS
jgi:hypothetical protein